MASTRRPGPRLLARVGQQPFSNLHSRLQGSALTALWICQVALRLVIAPPVVWIYKRSQLLPPEKRSPVPLGIVNPVVPA